MNKGLYWTRKKLSSKWAGLVYLRGETPFLRPSPVYNFKESCTEHFDPEICDFKAVKPAHMITVYDLLPEEIETGLYINTKSLLLVKVEGVNPFLTFSDVANFGAGLGVVHYPGITGKDVINTFKKLIIPLP